MKIDEIRLLYDYNDWANAHLLAACARVTPEQYAAPTSCGNGYETLRATMVHLLDSIWQTRITLQGRYKERLADQAAYDATELHDDAFPTFDALRDRWMTEHRELQAYLDTLTEETLNGMFRYVILDAVRERVMWHWLMDNFLHFTRHRSEAATLLVGYGQSPGDLEFTVFLKERA